MNMFSRFLEQSATKMPDKCFFDKECMDASFWYLC